MKATSKRKPKLSEDDKAKVAFMRFGLGPKPGSRARIGTGPNAAYNACVNELNDRSSAFIQDSDVIAPNYDDGKTMIASLENCCRVAVKRGAGEWPRDIVKAELAARYVQFIKPEVGFVERLALFWQNHFSIWAAKSSCWSGHMDRWAIRRNVLGNFGDMLEAVVMHPAMLAYLDNWSSYGPNSPIGRAKKYTYNENLAREILELHTLGVNGGYEQADVTEFAKVLTGWQIIPTGKPSEGQFTFVSDAHEPGPITVLKKTYAQTGIDQGKAVLRDLANHPSTATHIAYKLIRHFITDTPAKKDVSKLASVFRSSKGDLYKVSKALLDLPSAWTTPLARIRKPYVWLVSVTRGLGMNAAQMRDNAWRYGVFVDTMVHQPWARITPDGYPEDNSIWATPDSIRVRNDITYKVVGTAVALPKWPGLRPPDLVKDLFGPNASPVLAAEVASVRDDRGAIPKIFFSPEYLRS